MLETDYPLPWKEGYDQAIGALLNGRPFPTLADGETPMMEPDHA
jgi:hypothetical protein